MFSYKKRMNKVDKNVADSSLARLLSPHVVEKKQNKFETSGQEVALRGTDMVVKAQQEPLEDLHAGGVLDEVLNLILRLELQRRRAESMLINEKFIIEKLKSEIERLALKKARILPMRVQAEHDACVNDIIELNWHISFNQKTEKKLLRRCEIAER